MSSTMSTLAKDIKPRLDELRPPLRAILNEWIDSIIHTRARFSDGVTYGKPVQPASSIRTQPRFYSRNPLPLTTQRHTREEVGVCVAASNSSMSHTMKLCRLASQAYSRYNTAADL